MSNNVLSRRDFLVKSICSAAIACVPNLLVRTKAYARACPYDKKFTGHSPSIALIIDDVGFSFDRVMPFLQLNIPLTFSVLPHLPYSKPLAEKIHDLGHEVMLHQPMEPHNVFIDPGPGALFMSYKPDTIASVIERNITSIPHAIGCNNHMGSRYTESRTMMRPTLEFIKERHLFFVDSLTSERSIGFDTAKSLQMNAAIRNVFIDNVREKNYVYAQLLLLKKFALRSGAAIGIGHPRPETVAAIKKFLPELNGTGVALTYVSRLAAATS